MSYDNGTFYHYLGELKSGFSFYIGGGSKDNQEANRSLLIPTCAILSNIVNSLCVVITCICTAWSESEFQKNSMKVLTSKRTCNTAISCLIITYTVHRSHPPPPPPQKVINSVRWHHLLVWTPLYSKVELSCLMIPGLREAIQCHKNISSQLVNHHIRLDACRQSVNRKSVESYYRWSFWLFLRGLL